MGNELPNLLDSHGKPLSPNPFENSKNPEGNRSNTASPEYIKNIVEQSVIAHLAEAEKENKSSEQKDNNRLQRKSIRIQQWLCFFTACAFGAAAWYAHVAAQQRDLMAVQALAMGNQTNTMQKQLLTMDQTFREMRRQTPGVLKSADAAQKQIGIIQRQFQLEQRPYVTVSIDSDKSVFVPGRQVAAYIGYKNIGKSKALSVAMHKHMILGAGDALRQVKIEPKDPPSTNYIDEGDGRFVTVLSLKDTYSMEGIEVPKDQAVIWNGTDSIVIFGRVTYSDIVGAEYCTPFLLYRLPTGAFAGIGINLPGLRLKYTDLCPPGTDFR